MASIQDLKIGHKIRALRLASDLTQTELADRANLTKGFISQLENEQTSIGVDTLSDLLEALGMTLSEFFEEQADAKVVFAPKDRISVEGKGVSSFQLMVPGSTQNELDPLMVEMQPGEHLDWGDPHPGEQFGYVLSGSLTLMLDKTKHRVPAKHCFAFTADRRHQLRNDGKSTVKLLWVVTPPQM